MVFIRPTILRDRVQASFETNAKYSYIRDLQLQQAQEAVPLMRNAERPLLPEIIPPAPTAPPAQNGEAETNGG